jgi:phosphoribosylanthranilate isomerase
MGVFVKICGLNSAEAADAAARAGADFGGFIFHRGSPRNLVPDQARLLADRLRGKLRLVAVTSNASDDELAVIVAAVRPDFLQLHGAEAPERVAAIRGRFALPVIKAISIAEQSDFAALQSFEPVADMFLFDARAPKGAAREGGHGMAFDWSLLKGRAFARPFLLGGGLNPSNVARAIALATPYGVDVSSGVESQPGVKNSGLIADFVSSARKAQLSEMRA